MVWLFLGCRCLCAVHVEVFVYCVWRIAWCCMICILCVLRMLASVIMCLCVVCGLVCDVV